MHIFGYLLSFFCFCAIFIIYITYLEPQKTHDKLKRKYHEQYQEKVHNLNEVQKRIEKAYSLEINQLKRRLKNTDKYLEKEKKKKEKLDNKIALAQKKLITNKTKKKNDNKKNQQVRTINYDTNKKNRNIDYDTEKDNSKNELYEKLEKTYLKKDTLLKKYENTFQKLKTECIQTVKLGLEPSFEFYKKYRKSPFAPSIGLYVANLFYQKGNLKNARIIYTQIKFNFRGSPEEREAELKLDDLKNNQPYKDADYRFTLRTYKKLITTPSSTGQTENVKKTTGYIW